MARCKPSVKGRTQSWRLKVGFDSRGSHLRRSVMIAHDKQLGIPCPLRRNVRLGLHPFGGRGPRLIRGGATFWLLGMSGDCGCLLSS